MADLSEALVEEDLLGVRGDQPEVRPPNLRQHRPVFGLSVTTAEALALLPSLAGARWDVRQRVGGGLKAGLLAGNITAPGAQHFLPLLLLSEFEKSFINERRRGSLVTRLYLPQT